MNVLSDGQVPVRGWLEYLIGDNADHERDQADDNRCAQEHGDDDQPESPIFFSHRNLPASVTRLFQTTQSMQSRDLEVTHYLAPQGILRYTIRMNEQAFGSQMRRGAIEFCVLALLKQRPHYGFELVQRLSQAEGLLTSEGTIYPLLSRLRRDGMVETEWRESTTGPPRKYYRLTARGAEALAQHRTQWERFRDAIDSLLAEDQEVTGDIRT